MTHKRLFLAAPVIGFALAVLASAPAPAGAAPAAETVVAPSTPARSVTKMADLRLWDPGNIISDVTFWDSGTMSAPTIQTFLNAKGVQCTSTATGTCLKDYRQDTVTKPADAFCAAYQGAPGESAAQIIAKVSQACRINPQVLLTKLQVEQSLVSRTNPATQATYDKAMGYACPDTAGCDPRYAGFFNQVYSAAHRFREYPTLSWVRFKPGLTVNIAYNPNSACGSSPVRIANQATANLYNYTPYQPNAALLAGRPDACSAYGNLNFFKYFSDWFGSPTQNDPIGIVDRISARPVDFASGAIDVVGWALDMDTMNSIGVHIYVDGVGYAYTANLPRPDLGAAFRRGDNHGFAQSFTNVAPGDHQVCVYAINDGPGSHRFLGCQTVTVRAKPNSTPIGVIDAVSVSGSTVSASGWAFDADTPNAISVHVYVGSVGAAVPASIVRSDVGAAFGTNGVAGWKFSGTFAPGTYQVCAYAINYPAGPNPLIGCRQATVAGAVDAVPIGVVDAVTASGTSVSVAGWALDMDTPNPIPVHIYLDGYGVAAAANIPRGDVGAAFGNGDLHGYSHTFTGVAPGTHQVCVYAINAGPGATNPLLGCRQVAVAGPVDAPPIGFIDGVSASGSSISVGGWAMDPDIADPIPVHAYLDGVGVALVADIPRGDVGAAFGNGDLHGYSHTFTGVAPGTHQVCVYAINYGPGTTHPLLGCRQVTN